MNQNNDNLLPALNEQTNRQEAWLINNQSAIQSHNEDVAKNGVFSDGLRSF